MTSEVFNTDCLEYMRRLPDKAFQLAIADPPYGDANSDVGGVKDLANASTATNRVNHAGG